MSYEPECPDVPGALFRFVEGRVSDRFNGVVPYSGNGVGDTGSDFLTGWLSSTYECECTVKELDATFRCAQHAYLALLLNLDRARIDELRQADPRSPGILVSELLDMAGNVKEWERLRDAMRAAQEAKFGAGDLRRRLDATAGYYLLNVDVARNRPAVILMSVRSKARDGVFTAALGSNDFGAVDELSLEARRIHGSTPRSICTYYDAGAAGSDAPGSTDGVSDDDPSPSTSSTVETVVSMVQAIPWTGVNPFGYEGIVAFYADGKTARRVDEHCRAQFLGNFHPNPITVEIFGKEHTFKNSEAAYHAFKFKPEQSYPASGHSPVSGAVLIKSLEAQSGDESLRTARTYAAKAGSYHGKHVLDMMLIVLRAKFKVGSVYRRRLENTRGHFLLEYKEGVTSEPSKRRRWHVDRFGGRNWLGLCLMIVRDGPEGVLEAARALYVASEDDREHEAWMKLVDDARSAVTKFLGE